MSLDGVSVTRGLGHCSHGATLLSASGSSKQCVRRRWWPGGTLAKSSSSGVPETGQNGPGGLPTLRVPLAQRVSKVEDRGRTETEPERGMGGGSMTTEEAKVIPRGIVEPIGRAGTDRPASRVTRPSTQHHPETKTGLPCADAPVDVFKGKEIGFVQQTD